VSVSATAGSPLAAAASPRPPAWLFVTTALLTLVVLVMAVAETTLWMHYLIDGGEFVSLLGLAFITAAGLYLYSRQQLLVSLPLVFPWLLFPLITQGDQIIDHLSINPMRLITHVLLAAIFGTPVAVVVLAARHALASRRRQARSPVLNLLPGLRMLAEGRTREGSAFLAASLFVLEMGVAVQYLGVLMIVTLIIMTLATLWYGSTPAREPATWPVHRRRSERFALVIMLAGVAASLALYVAFKNRPGAYQGSPSYYLDPSQAGAGFDLARVAVPPGPPLAPSDPQPVQQAFTGYGRTLERLVSGYYILDRNYTWDFHNELFLRSTPLLPNYRAAALARIAEARQMRAEADALATRAGAAVAAGSPLAAALDDIRAFVAFNFDRAAVMEQMSAGFERTKSGLQHAAHLYEGEGKIVSEQLAALLDKHRAVFAAPATAPVAAEFASIGRAIQAAYANRVVGF
jgi:hypothetical protein